MTTADLSATDTPNPGLLATWGKELLMLSLVIGLVLTFRDVAYNQYMVPSASMEPNIQIGDHVIADMHAYGWRLPFTRKEVIAAGTPQRGDVVLFDSPRTGFRLIKRVAAIGGDVVEVRDGRVLLSHTPIARPGTPGTEWIGKKAVTVNLANNGGSSLPTTTIPAGMVLLLGDNRGDSFDGRNFGLVPESEIYGKAIRVMYRRGKGFQWAAQ